MRLLLLSNPITTPYVKPESTTRPQYEQLQDRGLLLDVFKLLRSFFDQVVEFDTCVLGAMINLQRQCILLNASCLDIASRKIEDSKSYIDDRKGEILTDVLTCLFLILLIDIDWRAWYFDMESARTRGTPLRHFLAHFVGALLIFFLRCDTLSK